MITFAYIISRIFDPGLLYAALVGFAVLTSALSNREKIIWGLILETLVILIPLGYFFYLKQTKKISDIDISNKNERQPLFRLATFLWLVSLILVFSFDLPVEIKSTVIIGLAIITVWTMITPYFKLSAHMAGASGLVIVGFLLFNLDWLVFVGPFLILLIAWSRLIQHRHTVVEIISGLFVSSIIVSLIAKMLFKL